MSRSSQECPHSAAIQHPRMLLPLNFRATALFTTENGKALKKKGCLTNLKQSEIATVTRRKHLKRNLNQITLLNLMPIWKMWTSLSRLRKMDSILEHSATQQKNPYAILFTEHHLDFEETWRKTPSYVRTRKCKVNFERQVGPGKSGSYILLEVLWRRTRKAQSR